MRTHLFLILFLLITIDCKKKDPYREAFLRSTRGDFDLLLVPHKYNLISGDWMMSQDIVTYRVDWLKKTLRKYGQDFSQFKANPKLQYNEKNGLATFRAGKAVHYTAYDYDTEIPIIFYGPNWIKNGKYNQAIEQQSIAATISQIVQLKQPKSMKGAVLKQILKESKQKPEIITTIILDQGGRQFLDIYLAKMPNLQALIEDSAYFARARVPHIETHTAVGHAAIGTGAYPKDSAIFANKTNIVSDQGYRTKYIYEGEDGNIDPGQLQAVTVGDLLNQANQKQSIIISQCYALRASIGMAGHGANGSPNYVYWVNDKTGEWLSDESFYSLPDVVKKYNSFTHFKKWRQQDPRKIEPTKKVSWKMVVSSPLELKMEVDMFLDTIQSTILTAKKDRDGFTDLAYITMKAIDAAGHIYGPGSVEMEYIAIAADQQIGRIRKFLQEKYGSSFMMVVSADHGSSLLPELTGGVRLPIRDFIRQINQLLPQSAQPESLISSMTVSMIKLNHQTMEKYHITEKQIEQKILSIQVDNKPFFARIIKGH